MVELEISCPIHGETEKIEVPDSYVNAGFEGEVRCAHPADSAILKIKIYGGHIVAVARP